MLAVLLAHLRVIVSSLCSGLHDSNRLASDFQQMIDKARAAATKIEQEIEQHNVHIDNAWERASAKKRALMAKLRTIDAERLDTTAVHHQHLNVLYAAKEQAEALAANLAGLLEKKPAQTAPIAGGL